jgi:heme O synthase-like polyprenyltransferase
LDETARLGFTFVVSSSVITTAAIGIILATSMKARHFIFIVFAIGSIVIVGADFTMNSYGKYWDTFWQPNFDRKGL